MKKGFTLIELLAVIVILAILALIVSPIISGVISDAKKAAAERSMEGYVKAVEFAQVEYQGKNKGFYAKTLADLTINYSGNTVSSPNVTFDQGIVKHAEADITTFHCVYDKGNGASCSKGTTNEDTGEFAYIKSNADWNYMQENFGYTKECYVNNENCTGNEDEDGNIEYMYSHFLGESIDLNSIQNITFTHEKQSVEGTNVSLSGDDSVIMYIVPNTNKVQSFMTGTEIDANDVYIYSSKTIKAPSDCTAYFANMMNLNTLNFNNMFDTSDVTDMNMMFASLFSLHELKFDDKFVTSKVIDMSLMFYQTGYLTMTTLNLGNNFDTRNVTDMKNMFFQTGYTAMSTFNLGNKFYTSNVTNMAYMFTQTGYTAMSTLNLGDNFNTSKVTDMSAMFSQTGYTAMTTLNFGNNFNTGNVTNMSYMFDRTGETALTTLNLGNNFNTSNATNMSWMFNKTGLNAMMSLDLGDSFIINSGTDTSAMFTDTGKSGCEIKAPTSVIQDGTHFKTTGGTLIEYTRGTITQR